jgi:alanine racemase
VASIAQSRYAKTCLPESQPFPLNMHKTRALIDPAALRHNIQCVHQAAPGCPVMAVVKANAYGHGTHLLLDVLAADTNGLAVARLSEATQLRQAGYTGRLLLFCGISNPEELTCALEWRLDLVLHDLAQLDVLEAARPAPSCQLHLWPKMDSGMHRLGLTPEAFASACKRLRQLPWCNGLTGMTHFACADEPDNSRTTEQLACFNQHSPDLQLDQVSLANSAALLAWPETRRGWIRPGLMLYGVNPLDTARFPVDLKPVMHLQAQVLGTREIPSGASIGYNDTWHASRTTQVAYIAAGYADGYPVTLNTPPPVGFASHRFPVIGRVSMDTLAIDCTDAITKPDMGDWVELWGKTVSVAEVARCAGTIPYQLLTAVSDRIDYRKI